MKRALVLVGIVAVVVVGLGISTHAAAGAAPHTAGECFGCALCEWVAALLH